MRSGMLQQVSVGRDEASASPQSTRTLCRCQDRHAMNNLTCNCVPRLDGVSSAELGRLFPEPSSTAPLLSLLQESGIDGFTLRSIVVSKDDAPILLVPLFESRFDLSTFAEGWSKRPLRAAVRLIPSVFHPRV